MNKKRARSLWATIKGKRAFEGEKKEIDTVVVFSSRNRSVGDSEKASTSDDDES